MNASQVQAWLNREPAAAGSVEYRRAALALGRAFEGLEARLTAKAAEASAPLPVVEVVEVVPDVAEVQAASIELVRPNRRGPYRPRASVEANSHVRRNTRLANLKTA